MADNDKVTWNQIPEKLKKEIQAAAENAVAGCLTQGKPDTVAGFDNINKPAAGVRVFNCTEVTTQMPKPSAGKADTKKEKRPGEEVDYSPWPNE